MSSGILEDVLGWIVTLRMMAPIVVVLASIAAIATPVRRRMPVTERREAHAASTATA